jgi:hypothetical protein
MGNICLKMNFYGRKTFYSRTPYARKLSITGMGVFAVLQTPNSLHKFFIQESGGS